MKSNYKRLGNYIRPVDVRNKDLISTELLGINIDKFFMPSVANVIGTDLRNYKLLSKGQFACNPMHVGRDEKLPIALYLSDVPAIVSPAYFVFEVTDSDLLCEYLMLWFRRLEFDRECWFFTDASVRGGISWESICDIKLPIPEMDEQKRIVYAYNTIEHRIELKRKINENLEAQAQAIIRKLNADNECASEHEIIKISNLCRANQLNIAKTQKQQTVVYLDTGSITKNYIECLQKLDSSKEELPSRCKRKVKHTDIIYSTVRPNLCHYGLILDPPDNLIVSTGFAVLSSNQKRISNEMIYLLITQERIKTVLQNIAEMSVSTYPSIDVDDLLGLQFEIPFGYDFTKLNQLAQTLFMLIHKTNKEIRALMENKTALVPLLLSSY